MIYQIEFDSVRSSTVRTRLGHIRTIPREGFRDRRYGTDLDYDCSPRSGTYYDGRYTVSVPPYLVVDTDNYTASPLAGSIVRTVGKILGFMRQWLWDRCRSQTYNPNVRRCPRLSASGEIRQSYQCSITNGTKILPRCVTESHVFSTCHCQLNARARPSCAPGLGLLPGLNLKVKDSVFASKVPVIHSAYIFFDGTLMGTVIGILKGLIVPICRRCTGLPAGRKVQNATLKTCTDPLRVEVGPNSLHSLASS
jgi:hypothetical protein